MIRPLDATPRVHVDPSNPGQFFACCGLLELADRLWGGAEGWFEDEMFLVRPLVVGAEGVSLGSLLAAIAGVELDQVDLEDDASSPVRLGSPFELRLDWWQDEAADGNSLKVWAGRMDVVRIARAMQNALRRPGIQTDRVLDVGEIVYDPAEPEKKVEPYYFDARRGASALPLNIGFSPDKIEMTVAAYPAVEFLCLVGLQRCRPVSAGTRRVFDYYTWAVPVDARIVPAAVCGLLASVAGQGFRFKIAFRSDQRKYKAFNPATRLERRAR